MQPTPVILALDCATLPASVALVAPAVDADARRPDERVGEPKESVVLAQRVDADERRTNQRAGEPGESAVLAQRVDADERRTNQRAGAPGESAVLAQRVHADERRTDAWVLDAIDAVLGDAGIGLAAVSGVAVSVGPGTFTGIRVGIATALGLAAPQRLPSAGISTLDALALIGLRDAQSVLACLDARRQQVYAAWYDAAPALPTPTWGPAVCAAADIPAAEAGCEPAPRAIGSGAALAAAHLELEVANHPVPLAAAVGELALRRWPNAPRGTPDWPPAEPAYLRPPDATPPQNPLLAARRQR